MNVQYCELCQLTKGVRWYFLVHRRGDILSLIPVKDNMMLQRGDEHSQELVEQEQGTHTGAFVQLEAYACHVRSFSWDHLKVLQMSRFP